MQNVLGLKAATTCVITLAALGLMSSSAQAATFSEPPDAGSSLLDAGDTTTIAAVDDASDPLTTITGFLRGGVDLYKIQLNSQSNFVANAFGIVSTAPPAAPVVDPQLFLFDSNGVGLFANDDGGPGLRAAINAVLQPGQYFLGISKADIDPINSNGRQIFPDRPFPAQVTPRVPNAVLDDWAGVLNGGIARRAYQIDLSATPVPTPALLPGLLAFGAGIVRKKRQAAEA